MTLPVEVVRSKNRRKTVEAVLRGGIVRLHVPARMTQAEIDTYAAELVPRLERKFRSDHIDLEQRAGVLARRYQLPRPASIVWTDNQRKQWGSCDTITHAIRISTRLAAFPPWVLDYVIVHELAHLLVADHSPAFAALVDRYPRAERARGYLLAKQDDPFGGSTDEPLLDTIPPGDPLGEPDDGTGWADDDLAIVDPAPDPTDPPPGSGVVSQGHLDLGLAD